MEGGAEIIPFVVFDDIPLSWLNAFEHSFIMAARKISSLFINYLSFSGTLVHRYGSDENLWNTGEGSIHQGDMPGTKNPEKLGDFGVFLALLTHDKLKKADIEEESDEESDKESDE